MHSIRGAVESVLGPVMRRSPDRPARPSSMPSWVGLALALLCFGGGFLVGGHFAEAKVVDPSGLQAGAKSGTGAGNGAKSPGIIGEFETKPIHNEAFIVALYEDADATAAKAKAKALGEYLRGKGLAKARPYEYPTAVGPRWVVAVYYDGAPEQRRIREQLLALPADVPDEVFQLLKSSDQGWPTSYPIL